MTQHTIPEVGEIPTEVRLKILYESEKAAIDQKHYHTYPEKLAYQLGYERAKCIDYLSTPPSSASSQGSMREAAERKAHAIAFGIWLVASEDVMFLSAAQLYENFIDEENIKRQRT